jgi:hypothetical protein
VHTSSHAACCNHFRWSSSNPRRCKYDTHVIINQSINQSYSALQKIRSWVMSFDFLLMISSLGLLQLIRDSPSCSMFFRSYKQRHLLQPMSSEPGHYCNGCVYNQMLHGEYWKLASFQPNNTKTKSVAYFERMFMFMFAVFAYTGSTDCIKP